MPTPEPHHVARWAYAFPSMPWAGDGGTCFVEGPPPCEHIEFDPGETMIVRFELHNGQRIIMRPRTR